MAIRFFWGCEDINLSAGVDYSAGDTSAAATGGPAISATGVKVGTNGIVTDTFAEYYSFDCSGTNLAQPAEGACGFWVNFPTWPTATAANIGVALYGANASDYIVTEVATGGTIRVKSSRNGGTTATAEITTSLSAATWYFIVFRWDTANTLLKIEAYTGTSTTPAFSATNSSAANCMPVALASGTGVRIGNKTGTISTTTYYDNIFISDDYDEPLHLYGNRDITDIDSYTTSAAVKYLKVLADASAASATGVEVVVYNAPAGSNYITGTTRYGSANDQAFEATLEAGEAVLLVPATSVGCGDLAASTTVAALAQNTTYTTGMVSATIVEV